jgi:hypothetical protein
MALLTARQRALPTLAAGVVLGLGYIIYVDSSDLDFSIAQLRQLSFWFAMLGTIAVFLLVCALIAVIGRWMRGGINWLGWKLAAHAAPAVIAAGRRLAGILRFLYIAALFWGINAFVYSLKIWGVPSFSGFDDPILKNPLFWLTWLALTTTLLLASIAAAVLLRDAVIAAFGKLRKVFARKSS